MSQSAAKIAVEIVGRDAGLRKMLDETKGAAKNWGADVASQSRVVALGLAGVASAASVMAVGIHAVATESAVVGRELESMAGTAGLSVEAMQAVQYASQSVGVEGQKAADIFKDFRDKLGDFRSTGGGDFADFFEQVGDKVGLTADQLTRMSGPDALIAVKKAMDDANISADRQIFYLEGIASDASALIPLLKDGGDGFREMTERFMGLNAAMSQSEIDKFKEYDQDIKDMQIQWDSLTRDAALPFLSVLKETVRVLNDVFGDKENNLVTSYASGYIKNSEEALNGLIERTKSRIAKLEGDSKQGGGKGDAAGRDLEDQRLKLKAMKLALERKQNGNRVFGANDTDGSGGVGSGSGAVDDKAAKDRARAAERSAAFLQQLDQQFASEQEKLRLNLQQQLQQIEGMQLTRAELERRGYDTLGTLRDDYSNKAHLHYQLELEALQQRDAEKKQREQESIQSEYDNLRNALISKEQLELESYTRRQQQLWEFYQTGVVATEAEFHSLSQQNHDLYLENIGQKQQDFWANYLESIRKTTENTDQLWGSTLSRISNQTSSTIMSSIKDWQGMGNVMRTVIGSAGESIIQTLIEIGVQRVTLWTLEKVLGAKQASSYVSQITGQAQAMSSMAALNAYASAAATPVVGWMLAPGAAAMATAVTQPLALAASAAAASSLAGMAHDGIDYIPQEGTWLLDKGERVLSPRQNADFTNMMKNGGGGVNVTIIADPERAGQVEQSDNGQDVRVYVTATLAELENRVARGGNTTARTFEGAYGLSRATSARR